MTRWDILQLMKIHADPKFQRDFSTLVALKILFEKSIVKNGYMPPAELESAISLTPNGDELVPKIQANFKDISMAEIKYALFLKFYHQNLLIDVKNTNPLTIQNILNGEILNGNIRYPWIYEKVLYDRFFEIFSTDLGTYKLSYEQTLNLLDGTPQGVFQIRDFIVGPFGVLTSPCLRHLPPTLKVPLWHCPNTACNELHPTKLSSGDSTHNHILEYINKELDKAEGVESQWDDFFYEFSGRPDFYDDMHLAKFPWLLINGFSEKEIKIIIRSLIEQHSEKIRNRFPTDKKFSSTFLGSGNDISMNLNKYQIIQIILLMPDDIIISCIESLVDTGTIKIPPTEIRNVVIPLSEWSAFSPSCMISRLGVQSSPQDNSIAILRLKRLVKHLYAKKDELDSLYFKLRFEEGKNLHDKLDNYLYRKSPKDIIQELCLTDAHSIERTFKFMRYGNFCIPSTREEQDHIIDKILWKLGFDIPLYPPNQTLFWDRLNEFLEAVKTHPTDNEKGREIIRSAGVNFFVSLEDILNMGLSFITWALFSDHYGTTKFKYNFSEAQCFMASHLNGKSVRQPLIFDVSGKNNLYPLIRGFALVAELCDVSLKHECDSRRTEPELPNSYKRTDLLQFPFVHKKLILDICQFDSDQLIKHLQEITEELEKSQIAKIRNQLDHKRDEFPSKDEIEYAVNSVRSIISKAEISGVIPSVYTIVESKSDRYGREVIEFENYDRESISIVRPSQYWSCNLPSLSRPQIIVPYMHIGDSRELIRFEVQESSDFVEMWKNYPKKRIRSASDKADESLNTSTAASL